MIILSKIVVILYALFMIFGVIVALWIIPPFLNDGFTKKWHIIYTGASYFLMVFIIFLAAAFQVFHWYPLPSHLLAFTALALGVTGMLFLNADAKERRKTG